MDYAGPLHFSNLPEGDSRATEEQRFILSSMEGVANMGSYQLDLSTMKFRFSDGLYKIFGDAPGAFEPSLEYLNSRSRPEDSEAVRQVIEQAASDKRPYHYIRHIKHTDGGWRIIESNGKVICDESGNVIKLFGIVRDVTKEKEAALELKANYDLIRSTFDTSLMGIIAYEEVKEKGDIADFKILLHNRVIEESIGHRSLVGKLVTEEFPGVKKTGLFDLMVQVMTTDEPGQMEYKYEHDGIDEWFLTMFVKFPGGLVGTTLNITADKVAQEERNRNYAILKQTEQILAIGSWLYDVRSEQMSWSEGMRILFPVPNGEKVTPEIYFQFILPEERDKLAGKIVDRIKKEFQDFDEQLTFIIEGKLKKIQMKATPLVDANGIVIQMVGIDMDITERSKAEEKTRENEFMKALLEKKDEFLSVASHELKTPVTTLKASLQVLCRLIEKQAEEKELLVFAKKASQQVNKVVGLLSDLMDNAKIQAGKLNLNKENFSMQEIIEDCIAFQTAKHDIQVENHLTEHVYADKARIEQVLVNFLSNAIKYSPKGKNIIIKAAKEGPWVKVEVTDFGIGVPPEKIDHVFDRFFRVEDNSQEFSGLGLGLYISSEIIKKHGGSYGAKSQLGHGSAFWFTIPLA